MLLFFSSWIFYIFFCIVLYHRLISKVIHYLEMPIAALVIGCIKELWTGSIQLAPGTPDLSWEMSTQKALHKGSGFLPRLLRDVLLTCWLMTKASHVLITVGERSTQLSHGTGSHFCCKLLNYVGSKLNMHLIVTFLCKVCGVRVE